MMMAKDMLPLLVHTEARLKLQGGAKKGKSQAVAYAAKKSRGFAQKKGHFERK
jgi:hypothetical protein